MGVDENKQKQMMRKIMETGFYLLDLKLYLDTHPDDKRALEMHRRLAKQYRQQTDYFSENIYPLTSDMAGMNNTWDWIYGPFPPAGM